MHGVQTPSEMPTLLDLQFLSLTEGRLMQCIELRTDDGRCLFRIDRAQFEVLEENMGDGFDMGDVDEEALEAV